MMKKLVFYGALVAAFIFNSAYAQTVTWFPLSSSMFILPSMENKNIMLSAGIDSRSNDLSFRILDITGTDCKHGFSGVPDGFSEITINAQRIQADSVCINGNHLYQPKTKVGQIFLREKIESGHQVIIQTDNGQLIVFKGVPPTDLLSKLLASRKAL